MYEVQQGVLTWHYKDLCAARAKADERRDLNGIAVYVDRVIYSRLENGASCTQHLGVVYTAKGTRRYRLGREYEICPVEVACHG